MTDVPARKRHPGLFILNALPPILVVLAFCGLLAQRLDTNTRLARDARTESVKACDAVRASNDVTVGFLRAKLVPTSTDPRHAEAEAFVDGLAAQYVTAYAACIAGPTSSTSSP